MAFELKGIDVSSWQGDIAWDRVKRDGIQFAMLRAAASTRVDKKFVQNISGAAAQGIPCGVYLYSMARTPAEAAAEAELVLSTIRPYHIVYPVAYDIEDKVQQALTKAQRTELVKTFCGRVAQAGYRPAVYSSLSWFNTMLDMSALSSVHVWVAQWGVSKTDYKGTPNIWQYSDKGTVAGIDGPVDMNIAYWDYAKASSAPTSVPVPTSTTTSPTPSQTPEPPAPVPATAQPAKPQPQRGTSGAALKAGAQVTLANTPMYASATAAKPTGRFSGKYWIYDGIVMNGRLRLTNASSRVNKKPIAENVTAYVNVSGLKTPAEKAR